MAHCRRTLLIMGSSIVKATNGRALHFLDSAPGISRVIFVNPDPSRLVANVASDLGGWGLPQLRPGFATPATCVLRVFPPVHSFHTRRDRVASLLPCRLFGASVRRAPSLGLGRALILPWGWNNAAWSAC